MAFQQEVERDNNEILLSRKTNEEYFCDYLRGDENGLRVLIDRHGDNLTYYINGYIHDLQESEDLMIEAFSLMLVKKPRFEEFGFKTYLYKTARNLALRHTQRSRSFLISDLDELAEVPASEKTIDDHLHHKDQIRIIGQSLEQINPEYREAIYLFYFEDMSYSQAAEVMKKTEKQLANLIYRGKQALKGLLEKEGITYEEH